MIVSPQPVGCKILDILERFKQVMGQPIVAHRAVIALDISILLRQAGHSKWWLNAGLRSIAPTPAAEMALPFFCQGLRDDLDFQALLGIHLLQAPVFVLQFLHAGHQRGVHAAELGAPFVERGVTDAVLAAQLGAW